MSGRRVALTVPGLVAMLLDGLTAPVEGWVGARLGQGPLAEVLIGCQWAGSSAEGGLEALVAIYPEHAWLHVRLVPGEHARLVDEITRAAIEKREELAARADEERLTSHADAVLNKELELSRGRCPLRALRMVHAGARRLHRRGELTDERAARIKSEVTAIKKRARAGWN